jgi:pyruvate dehydrogenase E2 component (dihydrolipoamide acetyltransferase)
MPFSIVMPALEMAQETGKLLAWRKKEGDRVSKGEPLLEIETDKAVVEVEAPADGVLAGIKAAEGAEVPVGQTIAWIVAAGEQVPEEGDASFAAPTARTASQSRIETPALASPRAPGRSESVKISPKARRLAKELGVDIATLRGSGSGGEILASDIQAAAGSPPRPDASGPHGQPVRRASLVQGRPGAAVPSLAHTIEVPTSIGRIMAVRTTQSWTTVPHFFVSRDVDATGLNGYRDRIVAEIEPTHQVRVSHTDLLVALVSRVLLKHPRLNASWSAEGIRLHDSVNMGLAIAVHDGVVAAVIRDAHVATLAEIAVQRHDLSERARAGKLRPSDIADATFTISNLGMYEVDRFSAIITPPQAAILAVGAIADRVVAVDGKPAVRPMMSLTLSCDHRVADGARAAQFLQDLVEAAHDPGSVLR